MTTTLQRKVHKRLIAVLAEPRLTYSPRFIESCATCAYKPSERCSPQCKHNFMAVTR